MLIWCRSKYDELVMTVSLLFIAIGVYLGATLINVPIGSALLIIGIVIFGLGTIWKS